MSKDFISQYIDKFGKIHKRNKINKIRIVLYNIFKRMFDTIIALLALIVLSPLLIILSIIIKIDSKGPIVFKQQRTGKNGKIFYLYKFRSMVADNNVRDFSKQDMHTKVGKILRKTSLDELPQLINVLKQEMSFIGPRPWIPEYYENMNNIQRHRNDVRPGITGLAQCMGRNSITIFDKINYDLEYIKNYSLIQDIKIIFLTVKSVFAATGVDAGKSTIQNELEDLKKQKVK